MAGGRGLRRRAGGRKGAAEGRGCASPVLQTEVTTRTHLPRRGAAGRLGPGGGGAWARLGGVAGPAALGGWRRPAGEEGERRAARVTGRARRGPRRPLPAPAPLGPGRSVPGRGAAGAARALHAAAPAPVPAGSGAGAAASAAASGPQLPLMRAGGPGPAPPRVCPGGLLQRWPRAAGSRRVTAQRGSQQRLAGLGRAAQTPALPL